MNVFKKILMSILVVLILSVLAQGCKPGVVTSAAEYRQIARQSLTGEEQATITSQWRNAPVNYDDRYWETGEDAVSVTFYTKDGSLLGPIVVFIDPETKVVLGQGLRL